MRKNTQHTKALLKLALCLVLMLVCLPTVAFAEEGATINVNTLTTDLEITSTGYTMNGNELVPHTGSYTLEGSTSHRVIIRSGAHQITAANLTIVRDDGYTGSAVEMESGTALDLVLAEGSANILTGGYEGSGIRVVKGASLTISGNGMLTAGYKSDRNIAFGAAIGGGYNSDFGTITINGGTIIAEGAYPATIGSGNIWHTGNFPESMTGTIVLNGGTIIADRIGNRERSGAILRGSGAKICCDTIVADITGLNVPIFSKDGNSATTYGNVTLADDFTVPTGGLTVTEGFVLTVPEGKTLTVGQGVVIKCRGAIVNNGTIAGGGTVDNRLAQSNLAGNGTVEATVLPICNHSYGDNWEPSAQDVHTKPCEYDCGMALTETHTAVNGSCITCGKELSWFYSETEKTLYICKNLNSNEVQEYNGNSDIKRNAKNVVIAEGVTSVPDDAIGDFYNIKSIYISETVGTFGESWIHSPETIVVYGPSTLKNTFVNMVHSLVYVSYNVENNKAKVTEVEVDAWGIDSNAVLDTVLYGKEVYFADGTLANFPNTPHTHRGSAWTDNGDGNCSGTCGVCNKSVTAQHAWDDAEQIDENKTEHLVSCSRCGEEKVEAHSYTYTTTENKVVSECICGYKVTTTTVEDVNASNVALSNKADLEKAKADLEKILADESGACTDTVKGEIEEELQRIEAALTAIKNAESVEVGLGELPATVEPDDDEAIAEIVAAKKAYDELGEHEKSMITEAAKKKMEKLLLDMVAYDIVDGEGDLWTEGGDGTLTFTANGSFNKFVGIEVDGKTVDPKHYDVKSGSTIITLKASYLETLSVGEHTITVIYPDGETDGKFYVKASSGGFNLPIVPTDPPIRPIAPIVPTDPSDSTTDTTAPSDSVESDSAETETPGTGDDTNFMLYGAMIMVSLVAMVALLFTFKKRKQENV